MLSIGANNYHCKPTAILLLCCLRSSIVRILLNRLHHAFQTSFLIKNITKQWLQFRWALCSENWSTGVWARPLMWSRCWLSHLMDEGKLTMTSPKACLIVRFPKACFQFLVWPQPLWPIQSHIMWSTVVTLATKTSLPVANLWLDLNIISRQDMNLFFPISSSGIDWYRTNMLAINMPYFVVYF